jgi:hypothetical protein
MYWRRDPINSEYYDDLSKASAAMRIHSGIKRLEFESALKHHTTPQTHPSQFQKKNQPGEIRVPLVLIFGNER